MGCRFCGAGDYFVRNLTSDEIVAQVEHCLANSSGGGGVGDSSRLQIMFMAMGEPALNMGNVLDAIGKLSSVYPSAELLVSTSGPSVSYDRFIAASEGNDKIGLQLSVHESLDGRRDSLIPFNGKLTLRGMADLGKAWNRATGRKPFINYCAHRNNASIYDADRIAMKFDPDIFSATVSVICKSERPMDPRDEGALATHFARLLRYRGFDVRVFNPEGQDTIGAGCGQLWDTQYWMLDNSDHARKSVGYGRAKI
jgi:23S rRNA (adenine2503-C2)-methyltransferase